MSTITQTMNDGNSVEVEEYGAVLASSALPLNKGTVHALITSGGGSGYIIRGWTIVCPSDLQSFYDDQAAAGSKLERVFLHPDDFKTYESCFAVFNSYGIVGGSAAPSIGIIGVGGIATPAQAPVAAVQPQWPDCFQTLPAGYPARCNGKTTHLVLKAIEYAQQCQSVHFFSPGKGGCTVAIKYFEAACRAKSVPFGRTNTSGGYLINQTPIFFQEATVTGTNTFHTEIVILDDEHLTPTPVVFAAQAVAKSDFITMDLLHTRRSYAPVTLTGPIPAPTAVVTNYIIETKPKKCECGCASIKSPIHSSWCPLA